MLFLDTKVRLGAIQLLMVLLITSCGGGNSSGNSSLLEIQLPPTLTFEPSSSEQIIGGDITLTWTSIDASSCEASRDWSGDQPLNSSANVTIGRAGTSTFELTCSNSSGSTALTIDIDGRADQAPEITSTPEFEVEENQTEIGPITAIDADGDTVIYEISGSDIEISPEGMLSFITAPDFETQQVFNATVTVTGGFASSVQGITVNVTDVNDPPIFTTASNIRIWHEYAKENHQIAYIYVSDIENDAVALSVESDIGITITNDGLLQFSEARSYSEEMSHIITVSANDGTSVTTQSFSIDIDISDDFSPQFNNVISIEIRESELLGVPANHAYVPAATCESEDPRHPHSRVWGDLTGYCESGSGYISIDESTTLSVMRRRYEEVWGQPYGEGVPIVMPAPNVSDADGQNWMPGYFYQKPSGSNFVCDPSFCQDNGDGESVSQYPSYYGDIDYLRPIEWLYREGDTRGFTTQWLELFDYVGITDYEQISTSNDPADGSPKSGTLFCVGHLDPNQPEAINLFLSGDTATNKSIQTPEVVCQEVLVVLTNDNDNAPEFISTDNFQNDGSGVFVGTVEAIDNDGTIEGSPGVRNQIDTISFSLSGADVALFEIDSASGALAFLNTPDQEGSYNLIVTASDQAAQSWSDEAKEMVSGPLTTSQEIIVDVVFAAAQ
jgi:hypothetical protein